MGEANAREHIALILAEAWKRTTDFVVHDLLIAFVPAAIITVLLYLNVIGKKLAASEYQSWLIVILGLILWGGFAFVWNVAHGVHTIWHYDQQRIATQEQTIATLSDKMMPALSVVCDESYRTSPDRKWTWVVFRVHNNGIEPARGCFVKVVSFLSTFAASEVGVRVAAGMRLKWTNTADETVVIHGQSNEYVNIAFRQADLPNTWAVAIQGNPEQFPMPSGVYELGIEVCGDNVVSQTTQWRITYKPATLFQVVQIG